MLRVWNLSLVHRDVLPHDPRHVPHPLRRRELGPRVHAVVDRPWLLGVPRRRRGRRARRSSRGGATSCARPGRIDSPVSREAAFLANNLLFAGLAFVVLLGTVFPLLAEAVQGQPALGRRALLRPDDDADRARAAVPHGGRARAAVAGGERRGAARPAARPRVGGRSDDGRRGRARRPRRSRRCSRSGWPRSRSSHRPRAGSPRQPSDADSRAVTVRTGTVRGNPRRYGGLIVHIGVVLIAVALASSSAYTTPSTRCGSERGESATVAGYTVTLPRHRRRAHRPEDDGSIARGAHRAGRRRPRRLRARDLDVPEQPQAIGTPSVRTGLLEDVYLTLISSPNAHGPRSRSASR